MGMHRRSKATSRGTQQHTTSTEESLRKRHRHPTARHNLGYGTAKTGNVERARRHWIIAANLGHHESLKALRQLYANGYASKEDYADALRAYQAAVDATKSPERERAEEVMKKGEVSFQSR